MEHPPSWWEEECPSRGAALPHAHNRRCDVHRYDVCCECGEQAPNRLQKQVPAPPEESDEDISIQDRLEAIGLVDADGTPTGVRDENTPVEPRYITGNGPSGPKEGPLVYGRGALTDHDRDRILFHVQFLRSWGR